jgi:cytochrome c2
VAQIKYILFACLMLLFSCLAIISFQKLSSVKFIADKPGFIDKITQQNEIADLKDSKAHQLFRQNCASCHAFGKVLSGPDLTGVMTRGPWAAEKDALKKWIKNPAAFIPTTQYTVDLQKQYGQVIPLLPSLRRKKLSFYVNIWRNPGPHRS